MKEESITGISTDETFTDVAGGPYVYLLSDGGVCGSI